ncbi:MAG TPA: RraA family protein [Bryobacteraceae bacterium]|jgi:regulator of RNase E activity RraA
MNFHPGLNRELIERLKEFDTALLANTIEYIDTTPSHEIYMSGEIQSVTPGLGPTTGIAYTIELDSSSPGQQAETDAYWRQLEEMSKEERPVVWVVKTVGSRPEHECVLGDGMAKSLYGVGCVGVVTDGGVRDVNGLMTVPFAAYCRRKTIHHCALRFRSPGEPVEVGGITIREGDVLHADSGGVIRLPATCVEELPSRAVQMLAFEREAHLLIRCNQTPLAEKRIGIQDLLSKYGFSKPHVG